jgi:hypothetical protein
MLSNRFEIVANWIDKGTGFRKYLEFGSHKNFDEAKKKVDELRLKFPNYTFSIKEIEGWD